MLSDDGVVALRKWLGTDGIIFFTEMLNKYNNISTVVEFDGKIPHPVHFREGMKVRNFLRTLPECANWSQDDFDNRWSTAVIYAIHRNDAPCPTTNK